MDSQNHISKDYTRPMCLWGVIRLLSGSTESPLCPQTLPSASRLTRAEIGGLFWSNTFTLVSEWNYCYQYHGVVVHARSLLQSCLTLCDPMGCSPPGSSVHGILQARILEWVAMLSSRVSSWPRDRTQVSYLLQWQAGSLPLVPSGKPTMESLVLIS